MEELLTSDLKSEIENQQAAEQAEFDAKVAELKAKYKCTDVYRLKIDDKVAWVKKPNRSDVSMAKTISEGNEISYYELLLNSVWLEGDEAIRNDDDYFLNSFFQLGKLIDAKKSELKKS